MNLSHRGFLLVLILACSPPGCVSVTDSEAPPGTVSPETAMPVLAELPEFSLLDEAGRPFGRDTLSGQVWVANFIFTRCASTCPLQSARMAELQRTFDADPDSRPVLSVSFSVDPEYDTPEVLAEYARGLGADPARWHFVTGSREALWDLSKNGFKLPVGQAPPRAAMPIFHSTRLVLVDRRGRIRGFYDGLNEAELDRLEDDVVVLLREPRASGVPPSADEWLDYTQIAVPVGVADATGLEERGRAQHAAMADRAVFHDFGFQNSLVASGIEFVHRITDDPGKRYKAAHYDHGNGLAVADVDGDDRLDLYFSSQVGGNQLWRNLGQGRFENITERAGVALPGPIGVTASFADIDNDGDPDLYVTHVRSPNRLFENDGTGRFKDISEQAGVDHSAHSSSAEFFDYDRDGLLDLFLTVVGRYTTDELLEVANDATTRDFGNEVHRFYEAYPDAFGGHLRPDRGERSVLYRNLGGNRFADVSEQTLLIDTSWSGDAIPADFDGDGWTDLYVLNMQGHDSLYLNRRGERFERQPLGRTPWGSMGAKVFDYDNDGRMDLFVTDMHSDMSIKVGPDREKLKSDMRWPESFLRAEGRSIFGNAFYEEPSNGNWDEVSDRVNAETYWPWGLSTGDLNADGYEDAFITAGMNYPFRYGVNSVLLNDAGKDFADAEFVLGVEPRARTAKPWFELDCGGRDREHMHCEDLDEPVIVWGALASRSSAIFDLDQDGDLDIVTNDFNSEPMLLTSDLGERHEVRYLQVKLVGESSNRDGLGSVVRVRAGDRAFTKVHDGQSGYMSQSLIPLYFGLGDAERVDEIDVRWPSGRHQIVKGPVALNQLLEIRER